MEGLVAFFFESTFIGLWIFGWTRLHRLVHLACIWIVAIAVNMAAIVLGALSLGSAVALIAMSAWLITRAWQMPPVLQLTIAVVTVRALAISRGVFGYCERLASHDTALRASGSGRERIYERLAFGPVDRVMRRRSGELVTGVGADVDHVADALVRGFIPFGVAAVLAFAGTAVIAVISPAAAIAMAGCMDVQIVGVHQGAVDVEQHRRAGPICHRPGMPVVDAS